MLEGSWTVAGETLNEASASIRKAVRAATVGLVDREILVELLTLAAIAEEHVLVIGEPGTAKSEAVRRVARALGGRYFEYLLGRFTEPSEIFGPIDLLKLQEGTIETRTAGMLPEAEIAFLDEVFLGSTAILNTLLGILNERSFRRGNTILDVPLRLCVGAANSLPEDAALHAFADRFLVRVFVSSVPDAELEDLLAHGLTRPAANAPRATLEELDRLSSARRGVDLSPARSAVAQAIRLMRRSGIALTDRRIVRAQNLIAAASVLAGRNHATSQDLWPLLYAVPTRAEQEAARDALRELLEQSESPLVAAALDASAGPRAHAAKIALTIEALFERPADQRSSREFGLEVEAALREIDASFPSDRLPEPLPDLRERLRESLPRASG